MNKDTLNDIQIQHVKERLNNAEVVLSEINRLADLAYISLSDGNLHQCQENIGQLICSLSEHFYEEIH